MLFGSTAGSFVKSALAGGAVSGNKARKEATAKRLAYYHDDQLDYLAADLAKRYADPSKLTPTFLNVVKKIVDQLSMVYCEPPTRTLEGSQKDQDLFAEIVGQCGLNGKMKQASRLVKLLKTILIRPVWRNNRLDLDLLTGNILDIATGDSPEDLTQVLITHYGQTNRVEEIEYSLWTPELWQRLNYRGQLLEEEENPYGLLPFVPVWDCMPSDSFWQAGGDDLIALQDAINQQLTSLLYTTSFQGFGVGWIKGQGGPGRPAGGHEMAVGPGSMVELGPGGELGFAATKAPIEEILGVIDKLVKWAAVSNGLPASSLTTEPTEESGLSKQISNLELQEKRRDDVDLWRKYEKQLFSVMRTVWNHHNPGHKISDGATLKMDFADPRATVSEKDQATTWQTLMGLGVIGPVDVALARNPDLKTREDALAFLLKIQDETAQLGETQI